MVGNRSIVILMLSVICIAALVLAVGPLVYYALSLYCIVEYFWASKKRPISDYSFSPPASILKPVRGVDSTAYENFVSYCALDYPEYEIIFAVGSSDDPVVPVVRKLQRNFPSCKIRLITDVERLGENDKVNNLCRLVKEAKYDLLVMTDSDVRVESDYLREVAAPFAAPNVGAVTSFYRCSGGGTLASDLDMLGMCSDSVPNALVARKLEGNVQFAFGWTMATMKQHLAEVGGWESMVNHHSDDFELGNRIAAKGHRVELMRKPVTMMFGSETFEDFFLHELRWSIGLRNVRPSGYIGAVFTHGLPWALLAATVAILSGWTIAALLCVAAYLSLRLSMAWAAGVWGLGDKSIAAKLWLIPLRDSISAVVWITGLFTDKIRWRGVEYHVRNKLLLRATQAS